MNIDKHIRQWASQIQESAIDDWEKRRSELQKKKKELSDRIHIPVHMIEPIEKVARMLKRLSQGGQTPTLDEVADAMGLSIEQTQAILKIMARSDIKESAIDDYIADWEKRRPELQKKKKELSDRIHIPVHMIETIEKVARVLKRLSQGGQTPTLDEVADAMGLSIEQTQAILKIMARSDIKESLPGVEKHSFDEQKFDSNYAIDLLLTAKGDIEQLCDEANVDREETQTLDRLEKFLGEIHFKQ